MRINFLLLIIFVSIVFFSFSGNYEYDLIGCTELNGTGCVCHNLQSSPEVIVWVKGPDTLMQGQTAQYTMFMYGGPAIAGGYNVASRFGVLAVVDSFSKWDYRAPNELTQAFSLPFANTADTVYWNFAYTAPENPGIDTIYSCGLSTNWDSIPNDLDLWEFGPKYPVTIIPGVPVELTTFTAKRINERVVLDWTTATETNNSGFALERSEDKRFWSLIAFIPGKGTTTEQTGYAFVDILPLEKDYYYRLKQTDLNGSFVYSDVVTSGKDLFPGVFSLMQNYPNPFNPSTKIRYTLPEESTGPVTLKVYDLNGKEISVLVNEPESAGTYEKEFNGSSLASGVYIYILKSGSYTASRKFVLLK